MYDDDDKQVQSKNKSRELELLTIRNIMKTENGRSFMWRCLENCGTFSDIFCIDTLQHARNSGKRTHGLWLDSELREAAKDEYFLMLKENYNE